MIYAIVSAIFAVIWFCAWVWTRKLDSDPVPVKNRVNGIPPSEQVKAAAFVDRLQAAERARIQAELDKVKRNVDKLHGRKS